MIRATVVMASINTKDLFKSVRACIVVNEQ
jgi:hypothetical protein